MIKQEKNITLTLQGILTKVPRGYFPVPLLIIPDFLIRGRRGRCEVGVGVKSPTYLAKGHLPPPPAVNRITHTGVKRLLSFVLRKRSVIIQLNCLRKSSCVNTRGIPTAAYQVLHALSCPGVYPYRGDSHPDLARGHLVWAHPGWGTPVLTWLGGSTLGGHPLAGVPPPLTWLGGTWMGTPGWVPCPDLAGGVAQGGGSP